ncbi:MAG: TolB-like 6-bladed beta-propeller domain-containing protein [Tannerella sp.]|jgi:hypothetical protein|nr:TolB-like 6-bladed beta-propeller domain-containing protein [Tannerella sp.]
MRTVLPVLLACGLYGCSSGGSAPVRDAVAYSYEDFGAPIDLKGEILPLDSIWKPERIGFRDSLLILTESSDDYFVHVYHGEKGYAVARNIPYGIGPDERLNCWSLQFGAKNVWAFDMQTGMMTEYPAPDFFVRSDVRPSRTVRLHAGATGAVALPDGRLVASVLPDMENLLTVYDSAGQKDSSVHVPYPELNGAVPDSWLAKRLFEYRIGYHEKCDRIVLFYVFTDLIEVYDSSLRRLARIQGPDHFSPELGKWEMDGIKQIAPVRQTKFAYVYGGSLTETEIWTLYHGAPPEKGNERQNRVLVFDYAGKPLRIYRLNCLISLFCVDETGSTLYGLSEQPEPCVIRFKIL